MHGVAGDLEGSLHKPRKGRRGEGGLPGVERYAWPNQENRGSIPPFGFAVRTSLGS